MIFLQFFNALLGGSCVTIFIIIVGRVTGKKVIGIITGILFGISWGMFNYSTDANIYILLLLLMLSAFLILTNRERFDKKRAIITTILMIIITSLHQIGFFFAFVVLTGIILRSKQKEKMRTAIGCIILYSISTMILYYSVYIMIRPLLVAEMKGSFFSWLTAYGHNQFFWTIFSQGYFPAQEQFVRAQANLFLHIQDNLKSYYKQAYIESYNTLALYILFHMIILLSALFELKKLILMRNKPNMDLYLRSVRIMLLVWFFLYFIFNQFYCAFEIHFKLFYLPPLFLIWALQVLESPPRDRKVWNFLTVVILVGIATWNITTGVIPNSHSSNNPFLRDVLKLKQFVKKGDLVIYARHQRYLSALTQYYTPADAAFFQSSFRYTTGNENLNRIEDETVEFIENRYERVILSDDAFESGYRQWFFSGYKFPPPHPDLLAIKKAHLIPVGRIVISKDMVLHEVSLDDNIALK
jgi:hypothetical protein